MPQHFILIQFKLCAAQKMYRQFNVYSYLFVKNKHIIAIFGKTSRLNLESGCLRLRTHITYITGVYHHRNLLFNLPEEHQLTIKLLVC